VDTPYSTPGLAALLDGPEPDPTPTPAEAMLECHEHVPTDLPVDELEAWVREQIRAAEEELCRRDLGEFVRCAAREGLLPGVHKLDWAPHLEAMCYEGQMLVEGWLVANGRGTPDMVVRQADAWASNGATWDDVDEEGASVGPLPEPWLRHVLVQNHITNIPPGTLKSTIWCVCLPAWAWLWAPDLKFGCLSAVDKNVRRDSNAHRDLVTKPWYRTTFRVRWTLTQEDAVDKWVTTAGGERISVTLITGITGTHVHIIIVDDPDDADKVWNEPIRRHTQDRWTRAVENRVVDERTAIRIVLQQRVHVDDLTAHLLAVARWLPSKRNGWMQLCIPMEWGRQPSDSPHVTAFGWVDWRLGKPGALLQPQRFTPAVLADKREKMADGYDGQYNCNPQPLTAGMFARDKLRFFVIEGTPEGVTMGAHLRKRPEGCLQRDVLPPILLRRDRLTGKLQVDWMCVSIDASNGGEATTSSACGLLALAGLDANRFVLDDRTAVMGIQTMYDTVRDMVAVWAPQHAGETKVLVEWKAAGPSVVNEIQRVIERQEIRDSDGKAVMATVEPLKFGSGDGYIARARSMVPTWNAGYVYVLDGAPWLYPKGDDEGFVGEVCPFPMARKDDRVDALDQAIIHYAEGDAERWTRAMCSL
jgi:phage terminase large subunit-like protein